MNVTLKSAGLIILCLVFSIRVFAQKPELNFATFTSKDGLSSNTVFATLKDRFGFLWIATEDGLNRFDGTSFKIFRHLSDSSGCLSANHVTALFEDSDGTLWVGTNGGFVCIYDRNQEEFIDLGKINSIKVGIATTSIAEDEKGDIWISSYSGLYVVNRKTHKIIKAYQYSNQPGQMNTNTVICVLRDSRNVMWVGTNAGLLRYNRKKDAFTRHLYAEGGPLVQPNAFVMSLAEDHNGRIMVGTQAGLHVLTAGGNKIRSYYRAASRKPSISSDIVYTVKVARNGLVWVGTEEGLNLINLERDSVYTYRADRRKEGSLKGKSIRSIGFDENGISWVGTFQGGISKFDPNFSSFNRVESNAFDIHGLRAPVVTSFVALPGKGVFVGTDGGGVDFFQPETGTLRAIPILPEGQAKKNISVLALERTRSNQLWVGTFLDGVYVVDLPSGKRKHITRGNGPSDLNFTDVFCIREDKNGFVWIGTNGGGVNLYNPRTGTIQKLLNNPGNAEDPKLLSHPVIRAFEEDQKGNMWIGSFGGGISVWNAANKTFTFYTKNKNNLANDYITTIHEDKKCNIWVGTFGGGLNLLNKKTGRFIAFADKDGLANNVVQKIVEDKNGKIWVSTNSGLSSFDPEQRRFKNYTHHNGLQNSPFVLGAGLCLPDGTLFFGGQEGFNYVNPSMLRTNRNVPSVVLTGLRVNNATVMPSEDGQIKQSILLADQIDLKHKDNFSISFVALNYTLSEQNRYEYRLKGVDRDWVVAGKEHTAYYTNLDPGQYVFEVRASNNDGIWSKQGRSVTIYVSPPFWRTTYAYLFYIMVVGGLILWMRYQGIRKLKAKFALERERLEAKQLIEQERRQAEHLRQLDAMKIKFLTNLSHEFRTPLSLIVGPVETLIQSIKEPNYTTQLSMIRRNGRRLLNLVNQLLDFRKMEEHELKIHLTCGDIIHFVQDTASSFNDVAERKKILYTCTSGITSAFVLFDHDKVERILFNLLSNAFKFTQEGGSIRVDISGTTHPDRLEELYVNIKVSDTGIGIPAEAQGRLFDRFFQHDHGTAVLNQGTGIGLSIVKEFVRLQGGTIELESVPGQGSTFAISIPFTRSSEPSEKDEEELFLWDSDELEFNTPAKEQETSGSAVSLLLVEDDEDFRFYIKDNLKSQYKIYESTNGKEGWQRALSLHPDIIVCDVNMPVMNGIELSKKLKADKRTCHIPIILLTASNGEEDQIHGLESGANDYMTKPFNFAVLNVKLRNLLAMNQQLKETYVKQVRVLPSMADMESENEKLINKVLLYIEENLHNPQLSVEALAKFLCMSRASLYNKVLEITGMSPVEFIRSVKLEKAVILLERSDLSIAQIAYEVGFTTPNYFARAFKTKFNMVPSEYITKNRKLQVEGV